MSKELEDLDVELKRLQVRREQLALEDEMARRTRDSQGLQTAQAASAKAVNTRKKVKEVVSVAVVIFLMTLIYLVVQDPDRFYQTVPLRVFHYLPWALGVAPFVGLWGFLMSRK